MRLSKSDIWFFSISLLFLFKDKGELTSFIIAVFSLIVYYIVMKLWLKSKGECFRAKIVKKL